MRDLEQTVKDDLLACIDIFGKFLNVRKYEMPDIVVVMNEETSNYNNIKNRISIVNDHIGVGYAYFEEIAHFYRNMLNPKKSKYPDIEIEEFFGRLGESVGRNLLKNTQYEELFKNHDEREWSNLDIFKENAEYFNKRIREELKSLELAKTVVSNDKMRLRILELLSIRTEINDEEYDLTRNINNYIKKQIKTLSDFNNANKNISNYTRKEIGSVYTECIKEIKDMIRLIIPEEVSDDAVLQMRSLNYDLKKNIETIKSVLQSPIISYDDKISISRDHLGKFLHYKGYVAAEIFVKNNPDYMKTAPKLFRMKNKKIIKKIFNKIDYKPYEQQLSVLDLTNVMDKLYHTQLDKVIL